MQQLTPYLRRRVLTLPVADRVELMQAIGASIAVPPQDDRLARLRETMEEMTGESLQGDRKAERVRARAVFCFVARREGFTLESIGKCLGTDHSTVHYLTKKVVNAFAMPKTWHDYLDTYDRYVKQLAI